MINQTNLFIIKLVKAIKVTMNLYNFILFSLKADPLKGDFLDSGCLFFSSPSEIVELNPLTHLFKINQADVDSFLSNPSNPSFLFDKTTPNFFKVIKDEKKVHNTVPKRFTLIKSCP